MPDTVEQPGGGPYDQPVEPRVSRLEEQMSDLRPILARIEAMLPQLATAAQVAELRRDIDVKLAKFAGEFDTKLAKFAGEVEGKFERFAGEFTAEQGRFAGKLEAEQARFAGGFNARLERLTGRVESLPTTWQMMTAIIAGQVALAGLLCAAVFGAARLLGRL
jgi:hypothetical protein